MEKLGHGEEKGQKCKTKLLEDFYFIFLWKKKKIVCMCKVLRLDKSNKVIQLTVTIKDVPRDNSD